MLCLPASLNKVYRPATDREVCSWSFGVVKAPRNPSATSWQDRRGTLEDQAIFGPVRDFHCACGKYEGERFRGMMCDLCGVKATTCETRRQRFGHINLSVAVSHPLGEGGERLSAVPVLPAVFWQAPAGAQLAQRYDALTRANTSGVCKALATGSDALPDWTTERAEQVLAREVAHLFELLLPVAMFAHEWDLAERQTLAHGLALESRESAG
jgi:hypothetical protein